MDSCIEIYIARLVLTIEIADSGKFSLLLPQK